MNLIKKINYNYILPRLIRVIVWDYDGTIFRSPEIGIAYEKKYFEFSQKNSTSRLKSIDDFRNIVKSRGSWKKAASFITGKNEMDIVNWVDSRVKKSKFVKPDKNIVQLIERLSGYQHLILSNAKRQEIMHGLKIIGFTQKGSTFLPFIRIFSRDDGINKPELKSFSRVISFTKLPARKHLIIGDSQNEDIKPARQVGIEAIHINDAQDILIKWPTK